MPGLLDRAYYRLQRRALRKKKPRLTVIGRDIARAFASRPASPLPEQVVVKAVFRALDKTGNEGLKAIPRSWWLGYVKTLAAADFGAAELHLIESSAALDPRLLEGSAWLELYRLCLISGLFRVGLEVRGKAEQRFIQQAAPQCRALPALRAAFGVHLELGSWDAASAGLAALAAAGELPQKLAHGGWLLDSLSGTSVGPFSAEPSDGNAAERALRADLQGKTVALVGPVPNTQQAGAEIDGFDRIAKFNYRGGEAGRDPATQGRRVDIAYYNIEQSKYLARKMMPAFLTELAFPVFIKDKGFRVLQPYAEHGRVLRNLQWLLLDSEFNAGPNAVFDLLRFAPQVLKLFNQDLMLTAGRFPGYVQPSAGEVNYCYLFAETHDPVIQFRYLKHAWEAGLIQGDGMVSRVMAMSLPEFIDKLQAAHGGIGREALNPGARSAG